MKVVFDTNILLSAFLWQKDLKPIYHIIREGKVAPCFTQYTWAEFIRALSYKKFEKQLEKIGIAPEEIIKLLTSRSYFVVSHLQVAEIKEDPSDNFILACALSCQASFIVSGDKHLLKFKKFCGIPIISPREFLKRAK